MKLMKMFGQRAIQVQKMPQSGTPRQSGKSNSTEFPNLLKGRLDLVSWLLKT